MARQFWLSDEVWRKIDQPLPHGQAGKPRVDDQRVLSGILHVLRVGWTPDDIKETPAQKLPFLCHSFELACADLNIEHRLTKPRHPWTSGQVDRMDRTIKTANFST